MTKKLPESAWRVPGADKAPVAAVEISPPGPGAVKEAIGEVVEKTEVCYEEEAAKTRLQLEDKGWCPWRCSVLNDEVIIVVRDELVTGYPPDYPTYTTQELIELTRDGVGVETIRLAHEAKKALGAKVEATETLQKRRK